MIKIIMRETCCMPSEPGWLRGERVVAKGRSAAWLLRAACDGACRRREAFHGFDAFLKPPAILRRPVLDAAVDAEIVRPMMRNVGIGSVTHWPISLDKRSTFGM